MAGPAESASAAVQLARALGAREVYPSVGGGDKMSAALDLGATDAVDHQHEDFAERVQEITGGRGPWRAPPRRTGSSRAVP